MPKSIESLSTGKSVPGDPDDSSEWKQIAPPPWFDQDKFERGIAFFRAHMSSVLFSYLLSLIAGFNLDVFLQTLLFTGQSSSPEISGKRYFATLLYILQWYDQHITDKDSKGYKSLMKVRRIHHHVRLALKKRQKEILLDVVDHRRRETDCGYLAEEAPFKKEDKEDKDAANDSEDDFVYIDIQGQLSRPSNKDHSTDDIAVISPSASPSEASNRDDDEEKLYLNQYDMALVQVAFVAGVVLYPDWIGINASPQELEDYIFTWRVFGWYLGIHDRYNICEGSFEDVRSIAGDLRDFELIPAIKTLSPDADAVARAFIKGSHARFQRQDASISTFMSPAALLSFSRRPFHLAQQYEPPDLTFKDEICIFFLHVFFFVTYYVPPFRRMVNSLLSLPNVMRLIA